VALGARRRGSIPLLHGTSTVSRASAPPASQVLNKELSEAMSRPVVKIDVIEVAQGERLRLAFKGTHGDWRSGVWLAVDGDLEAAGAKADQARLRDRKSVIGTTL